MHTKEFNQEVIDRTVPYLKDHYSGRLMWRNTMPGHPGCENVMEAGPQQNQSYEWDYSGPFDGFSWHLFNNYNTYAIKAFSDIGADIIHSDKLLRLRHDGHAVGEGKDCLHYKLPSGIDHVNTAIYNQLEAEYFHNLEEQGYEPPWEPVIIDDQLQ